MTVLNSGEPGRSWWIGVEVVCWDCNFKALLEAGDAVEHPLFVSATTDEVRVSCPNCFVAIVLARQDHEERRDYVPPKILRGQLMTAAIVNELRDAKRALEARELP